MSAIRVIQVGVGGMGNAWLQVVAASDEVEHAAWVDVNPQALQQQCQAHDFEPERCYTSLGEALAREPADGLINVTPPQFHEAVCCAGLEAGLPVLTEKPLADSLDAARRSVECAERVRLPLMVAQNYRYGDLVNTLRNLVAAGGYGVVGQVSVAFHRGPRFGGFREEMPDPLIVDMAIHHFDLMRHILRADPVSVRGCSWNPRWSWFRGDASVALVFAFSGGLQVVYQGSWCATGDETPWNGNWRIECEKGVIVLRDDVVYQAAIGGPCGKHP